MSLFRTQKLELYKNFLVDGGGIKLKPDFERIHNNLVNFFNYS